MSSQAQAWECRQWFRLLCPPTCQVQGFFSETGSLPKADGPPTDPLTQGQSVLPESLCCLFTWEKEPLFPPFSFGPKPFSFSFESTQKSSRYGNRSVAGGKLTPPIARKIPPYWSPNPPRCRVQKVPLRRKNRTTARHCCNSAFSANTLLFPQKTPQISFCTEGCGLREAGAGALPGLIRLTVKSPARAREKVYLLY